MKKIPKFKRSNAGRYKRLKDVWRKPRGIDNKQRSKLKSAGAVVKIGYRTKKEERGMHPSGLKEVLVRNLDEAKKINSKTNVVRISASVGAKKKAEIINFCKEAGIKVLNQ